MAQLNKKRLLGLVFTVLAALVFQQGLLRLPFHLNDSLAPASATDSPAGYQRQHHKQPITGSGQVAKLLADDNKGSRHQRFILRLANGQTLLVAHNIDIAPRINDLRVGDTVAYSGEYIWNEKGGILHWTHRDIRERRQGGWLRHHDKTYR